MDEGDVFISPQPAGSKSAFENFTGVVIIATIYFTGAFGTAVNSFGLSSTSAAVAAGATAGTIGTSTLIALGVAVNLALMGVQQLMVPDPSMDIPENTPESSYLFRGAEQTILEGDPFLLFMENYEFL